MWIELAHDMIQCIATPYCTVIALRGDVLTKYKGCNQLLKKWT
jgi:hypothetical protein